MPATMFSRCRLLCALILSLPFVWPVLLCAAASAAAPPIIVATYEGVINPVSAEYLHDALLLAEQRQAQALLVQLDTPGGLDTSMRLIIKDFTGSAIPVIVYVAPSGGRA